MPLRSRSAAAVLALAMGLAACSGDTPADAPSDVTATTDPADDVASPAAQDTEASASPGGDGDQAAASAAPDVRATLPDGTAIALTDYAGQQVFVETFATWCSNCRSQLGATQQAAAQAGDDVVFLALSVETGLDPAVLAGYQADNAFDNITFGVLEGDSLAVLEQLYGGSVLVPPSTPKFHLDPDGTPSDLTVGYESVDEILAQL